jgi:chorismate mutase
MMRSRNELRGIANRITDSPTEQDLADAQQAIFDLLDERSRLSQRVLRLRSNTQQVPPKAPPKESMSFREILFGVKPKSDSGS